MVEGELGVRCGGVGRVATRDLLGEPLATKQTHGLLTTGSGWYLLGFVFVAVDTVHDGGPVNCSQFVC